MTFFDKYTYKQKNFALIVLSVLLIAAAYKRAFSVSIASGNYQEELEQRLIKANNADKEIKMIQGEIVGLNRFLGEENNSIEKVQQNFLNFFAKKAKGISVHQIDEVLNFKHPDFEINTHRIVIKGDYTDILKFLYAFEKEFRLAKIVSVRFEYKRFPTEESKHLYATIFIQNYLR